MKGKMIKTEKKTRKEMMKRIAFLIGKDRSNKKLYPSGFP